MSLGPCCCAPQPPVCRPSADKLLQRWYNERLRLDRLRLQLEELQARLHTLEKQGAAEGQQGPQHQQTDEEAGAAAPSEKGAASKGSRGDAAAGSAPRRWCACGSPMTAEKRQEKVARLQSQRAKKEGDIADAERVLADLQVGGSWWMAAACA